MSIKCPKCHHENPDDTIYCGKCTTPLRSYEDISVTKTLETPANALTAGSTFAGRYQIIEELGKGGMGAVYRALDTQINEEVAIKLIRPEIASDEKTLERFSNELRLARKIGHKNVCKMFHLDKEGETPYISMEYIEGDDLKDLIQKKGKLTPEEAIRIAKQVCEGLAEAHRLGVVHRDLKPQNIMMDKGGQAKIMDFGIARSVEAPGVTATGVIIGTPDYISPEQAEGQEADQRSDIYSLGVILYEMVTGTVPFKGDTALSVALKHKSQLPLDPRKLDPEVSDDLSRLILICMEKDRERRYQSAEALLDDFRNIEEGLPLGTKIRPRRATFIQTLVRKKLLLPALVVILVVIALAIWQLLPERNAAIAPKKKMLVVLPFENLGSPEDEYFADGITDEIIVRMTNVADLGVIARNSAMQYKNSKKSIKEIGDELGVDYILSGTIRWQKTKEERGRVRVTPSLIKVSDSTQLWANIYDELFTEVFQVQSDISIKVVESLDIALLENEKQALEARPTLNMDAYDCYLRGIDYFKGGRDQERSFRLAIEMLEKAVDLDPKFLQAYAQLARAHLIYYWLHFDRSEERVARAKEAIYKASQIGADSAEVHTAQGYYFYLGRLDFVQALKHFSIALKKQPTNPVILEGIGFVKRRQGELPEAVSHLIEASEKDPRNPVTAFNIGETYALMRNYQEAERWYDRALFLNLEYPVAYSWKTRLFINKGDTKKARQVLEEASQALSVLDPNIIIYPWVLIDIIEGKHKEALKRLSSVSSEAFSFHFYFVPKDSLFAQIYGIMNDDQLAKKHYESAVRLLEEKIKEDPEDSRYHSALGIAYAGLEFKERAIAEAEKAVELLPVSKEAYRGTFRTMDLALVYTMVGEYDQAMDKIEYLLSIPGEMSLPLLQLDPQWASLKESSRFLRLIEQRK